MEGPSRFGPPALVALLLLPIVLAGSGANARLDGQARLIVRGDDFGATHAANAALIPAFEQGIMTSASVLVVGPWIHETVAILRDHPEWSVGLHLALGSEWDRLRYRPISPPAEIPSLVAPDGAFYKSWQNHDRLLTVIEERFGLERRTLYEALFAPEPPDPEDVERELRAQIAYAQRLGIRFDYLDCHQGLACQARYLPILQRLADELCVPIPEEGLLGERATAPTWYGTTPMRALLGQNDYRTDDWQGLREMLAGLGPRLWRYVGHPSTGGTEVRAMDSFWGTDTERMSRAELTAWTDSSIRRLVEAEGIDLVSIRELWDYETCRPLGATP